MAAYFLLDREDRLLVDRRRSDANRLGFAMQLCTVRFLGVFVAVPDDVPVVVTGYLGEQLGVDGSVIGVYPRGPKTVLEHQWEIRHAFGYVDFSGVEARLRDFLAARAWTRRERPSELFDQVVIWLRGGRVLLPGLRVLGRLVAEVGHAADQRMYAN